MNTNLMSDDELKSYHKRLCESHIELLRGKGVNLAFLLFYGLFACVGVIVWCIETALQYQSPVVKYTNYFLIISGACSLYFAYKKEKEKIVTKSFINEELSKVNAELHKRKIV